MTAAERVRVLSETLEGTSIGLLELTTPEETIRLRRGDTSHPPPLAAIEPSMRAHPPGLVTAPCPGVFRTAHPAQDGPLAQAERHVAAGEAVGLVQVGPLLVHIAAPASGVVGEVLAENGATVGYGTPLLRLQEERA